MLLKRPAILLACAHALAFGQGVDVRGTPVSPADPILEAIQLVSDTTIAADIRVLEAFGSRYARLPNRYTVAEWIRQRFIDIGVAIVDTVGFGLIESNYYTWQRNVVATIPGSSPGGEELIIGAHYDSQNYLNPYRAPGADDNASGVAGIIEIARVLRAIGYQPRATIRFVAFAGEELGLYGAYEYVDNALLSGSNILLMQNYDMIGYRDTTEGDRNVAVNEYQAASAEADLMVSLMQTYTTLTPHKTSVNIHRSDSWPFALRLFKAIFMIEDENDFNPHYHSHQDSSVYLDFTYAQEIVQAGIALTMTIDGRITDVAEPEYDPADWTLGQNYPNPFNPSTTISYRIPEDAEVTITVHNVLGEEIASLAAGMRPAGTHTVRWIPDVPSGMYTYTLLALPSHHPGQVQRITKKMILMR